MREKIEFIKACVYEAGERLRESLNQEINIDHKSSMNDLVTNMDREIEHFLVGKIKDRYDNQSFLTEEKTVSQVETDDMWIIDPIDGTVNFVFQKKDFAISIAYYHKHQPVFGIVYDVMGDKLYLGIKGEGAYCNGIQMKALEPIRLDQSVLYSGLGALYKLGIALNQLGKHILAFRYMGAASLEICGVASAHHQIYISKECSIWDIAAAVIILNEVNGYFNYGSINEIDFNHDAHFFVCAAQASLYQDLLNIKEAS